MKAEEKDYKMQRYTLRMRPITPVAVGAGEVLNAGIDYWVAPDGVRILKSRAFSAAIESEGLSEAFEEFVASSKLDVRVGDFLQAHGMEVDRFSYALPNYGLSILERRQMSRVMHSGGRPYLPGSTLKGALRTALLFIWLEEYEEGWDATDKMVEKLLALADKADSFLAAGSKMTAQAAKAALDEVFDESSLFGPIIGNRPGSQHLLVRDTAPCSLDALGAFLLDGVWLDPSLQRGDGAADSPSTATEAIRHDVEGLALEAGLHFRFPDISKNDFLKDLSSGPQSLAEFINYFAMANVEEELAVLQLASAMDADDRKRLTTFYSALKGTIVANPGRCYMRIGRGKTYFHNTLGLVLVRLVAIHRRKGRLKEAADAERAWKICRALAARIPYGQEVWPATRTVARLPDGGLLPAGWLEIEIVPQP